MAVTLFSKPGLKGKKVTLHGNRSRLKSTAVKNSTSSAKVGSGDRVLFFTKEDYHGAAMFRTAPVNIGRMSSAKKGGKFGFGNTLSSVRTTPFTLDLEVNFICNSKGDFPGNIKSRSEAQQFANDIRKMACDILTQDQAGAELDAAYQVRQFSEEASQHQRKREEGGTRR